MNFKSSTFLKGWSLLFFFVIIGFTPLMAQKKGDVYLDKLGVMRYADTKAEVKAFGVNYTAMFAHAYRTAKKLNISVEEAIEQDVYHFARLGFDAFRVHVWDVEISDSVGNLLANEHLRLLDFALSKMKERGMKFVITPIAFWPNGYPEPSEKTPGFAMKYGKDACLTNEDAIQAQERYLAQFVNHVNAYTGVAYKDEPSILAFEVSNEPHHRESPEAVTVFIRRMVQALRSTGTKKLILYNISHGVHLVDNYFDAGIQGGTFQWYPTGLGAKHELGGNFLPNVDLYSIPFAKNPRFQKGAKIVYEFDAADVGRSYIYPAMARSFREAGMQVATHFSYDPTYMADVNTEYNTHYMNLVYTPQKALSLKISSEVFHEIPLYKSFGRYPTNTTFDQFFVSYEDDLAVYNADTKFFYTNHNTITPKATQRLQQIAGYGNSKIVQYDGTGAYFLDKIEQGVWRLEVMPDAIWIEDPFGKNSLDKKLAVVNWRTWLMHINLPDLGRDFFIEGVNDGNTKKEEARNGTVLISPGTYIVKRKGVTTKKKAKDAYQSIRVGEFFAPATTLNTPRVLHEPLRSATAGKDILVSATIVTREQPDQVVLQVIGNRWRTQTIEMKRGHGYTYEASIPSSLVEAGYLRYYILVENNNISTTYPAGKHGQPFDWDFYDDKAYQIPVMPTESPIYLFNANTDNDRVSRKWQPESGLVPIGPGRDELQIRVEHLYEEDPEYLGAPKIHDYTLRYFFRKDIEGRRTDISSKKILVIRGRALNTSSEKVMIRLITQNAQTYVAYVTLSKKSTEMTIPLSSFTIGNMVTLPRPYPTFVPYYFESTRKSTLDPSDLESVQISIGPGLEGDALNEAHSIAVESIYLQ